MTSCGSGKPEHDETSKVLERQYATQFVDIINNFRENIGCQRLIWSDAIAEVANNHSHDMALRDYRAHTTLKNRTVESRLKKLELTAWAENIA